MIRRLFTAAALISLLLCVTTAYLWVRSYRQAFVYDFHRRDSTLWALHNGTVLAASVVQDLFCCAGG